MEPIESPDWHGPGPEPGAQILCEILGEVSKRCFKGARAVCRASFQWRDWPSAYGVRAHDGFSTSLLRLYWCLWKKPIDWAQ
jgi:hypothetical protein